MIKLKNRKEATAKRHKRIRVKLEGCAERPRMAVYRSNKHIYVQLIDDTKGVTLVSASSLEADVRTKLGDGGDINAAKEIGKLAAERAKKAGIEAVVFDRGGYIYHGRVAAVAEAAREAGLFF